MANDYNTVLSEQLSPIVEDIINKPLIAVGLIGTIAVVSLMLIGIIPWELTAVGWAVAVVAYYVSDRDVKVSKWGKYKETTSTKTKSYCNDCGSRSVMPTTTGYTVYYISGYEVLRFEDFCNCVCSDCESGIKIENDEPVYCGVCES